MKKTSKILVGVLLIVSVGIGFLIGISVDYPEVDKSDLVGTLISLSDISANENLAINAASSNILYARINNPIQVAIPGISTSDIELRMNGINLPASKDGKGFIVKPHNLGDASISIYRKVKGQTTKMASDIVFKVKPLPSPVGYFSLNTEIKEDNGTTKMVTTKFTGGKISKADLLKVKTLSLELPDVDFNVNYSLVSFDLVVFDSMGNARRINSDGSNFSDEQLKQLKSVSRKANIYISSIEAVEPDGITPKSISPIEIMVN